MTSLRKTTPKYVYYLVYTKPNLIVASFCLSKKRAVKLKNYLEFCGSLPLKIIKFSYKDLKDKDYTKHIGPLNVS